MAFVDFGLGQIGSYLADLSPAGVGSMSFGTGGSGFTGSDLQLNNEVIRTPVTWALITGSDFEAQGILNVNEANGSFLQELGLVSGSVGSADDLFTRDLSAIGSKNNTFSIIVTQTVRIRRE